MHMEPAQRAPLSVDALIALLRKTFDYFRHEANPANGLVKDNTRKDSHSSITAVGLGLACFPVAAERGYIGRAEAVDRVLATLRFFQESEQSVARTSGNQHTRGALKATTHTT